MLVATVLMTVGVSALCAFLLSMKTWSEREKLRSALKLHALEIAEELKSYAADKPLPLPGLIPWQIPGDSCLNCPGAPTCWALEPCTHDVSARLPVELRLAHGARMSYTVSAVTSGAQVLREVDVSVQWSAGLIP
jgi:hypothetical protein